MGWGPGHRWCRAPACLAICRRHPLGEAVFFTCCSSAWEAPYSPPFLFQNPSQLAPTSGLGRHTGSFLTTGKQAGERQPTAAKSRD